ncbi:MAG: tRNA pseudouridine(55) synthase TruB [Candidatus Latescibacteria bacterium]|nr:tRNA pseudouridine(55) synthase TruB [Candidatus Latescibacterota bacterium]
MGEQKIEGILVVNKEARWTSHDVVIKLRNILKIKKIGHTGTLDPLATGVLVTLLGRATKILQFLQEQEKEYIAQVCLGISTDTFDAQGQLREKREVPRFEVADIEKVCRSFEGEIEQSPPPFSAIKISGKRSYQLARAGRSVPLKPRRITISQIELLGWKSPILRLRVVCSKGTYIRALADDIGQKLGCGGHLLSLRRIRSGEFSIAQALTIDRVLAFHKKGILHREIVSIDQALQHLPEISLPPKEVSSFKHGTRLKLSITSDTLLSMISQSVHPQHNRVRVKDGTTGHLVGIGRFAPLTGKLCPLSVFA